MILDEISATFAQHLADTRNLPLSQAEQLVRFVIDRARSEENAAGTPYGDNDVGLIRWLAIWPERPPTA